MSRRRSGLIAGACASLVGGGAAVAWIMRPPERVDALVKTATGAERVPTSLPVVGALEVGSLFEARNAAKVFVRLRGLHAPSSRPLGIALTDQQMSLVAITTDDQVIAYAWGMGRLMGPVPGPPVSANDARRVVFDYADFEIAEVAALRRTAGADTVGYSLTRDVGTRKVSWFAVSPTGAQTFVRAARPAGATP